jgi:galactokinase
VPGRVCLFGEHSDWAGGFRDQNPALEKGRALIAGTDQGVHAHVRPHPDQLVLSALLEGETAARRIALPMERDVLLAEAQSGRFFSYAAGVAYQVLCRHRVGGLRIENHLTDLPVKKGLSSSAAVCVLIARAFNRVYQLGLSTRAEMDLAYEGEITTPSLCGRLDQACAYGRRLILMTFDGQRLAIEELAPQAPLHFVIIDLNAGKDTRTILNDLHRCYPFAQGPLARRVQEYLGPVNMQIVTAAASAVRAADAPLIGALMDEAQAKFDEHLTPASPMQLAAPVLHEVLEHPQIRPLVFGGKGVGSQGDGAAQFIARDAASQQRVIAIAEESLGMRGLPLSVGPARAEDS